MIKPWYKQFWPWFLITLPLCVVIAGITTLIIASQNSVSLVAEDYYKKGKGINIDLSKIKQASSIGLSASVSSNSDMVTIKFDKGELEVYPALTVIFTHRTLADRDFQKVASSDAYGYYRINLDRELSGPWFIEVQPHTQEWLLQGKISFPAASPVLLAN
ncbi:FixH family protein [Vibrio algarum]|uniref:FixH family protein n=1 Tax=Vibrio algarum TaxID=3020714 RepID=A0ABT4YR67_9VIBR|nr:FixH family protein [Vibrio sp. KJ40-1]MDB1123887.1 FixH family protein [Vibrio sp. KJ40-1]